MACGNCFSGAVKIQRESVCPSVLNKFATDATITDEGDDRSWGVWKIAEGNCVRQRCDMIEYR